MHRVLRLAGRIIWWCAWPVMWLYLRDSRRTRLLLYNRQNQLLMVKGWIASGDKWSLPGGGLHNGEEPLQGVVRELKEETGLTLHAQELTSLGDMRVASKGFRFHLYFYTAKLTDVYDIRLQRLEIADAQWVDVVKLTPDTAEPDVLRALVLLAPRG